MHTSIATAIVDSGDIVECLALIALKGDFASNGQGEGITVIKNGTEGAGPAEWQLGDSDAVAVDSKAGDVFLAGSGEPADSTCLTVEVDESDRVREGGRGECCESEGGESEELHDVG